MSSASSTDLQQAPAPLLVVRSLVGGTLMGLANLVPGISGGTMLLASGVYTFFIDAIAEITRFKFKQRSLLVLGAVVVSAGLAILLLAGVVKNLVVEHRWVMYSLFIGLTLGGLPVVWKMLGRMSPAAWGGAVAGFVVMALVAVAQVTGMGTGGDKAGGWLLYFIGGILGASAMILPGISGGYLLLVMGLYIPVLGAIDQFKDALTAVDLAAAFSVGLRVLLPVGLGVLLGIAAVSNVLRFLLHRYEKATLGVLLGLLVGAVAGLWPFQQGVAPKVGDTIKGRVLTAETVAEVEVEDYPVVYFRPSAGQVGGGVGLIIVGFLCTLVVSKVGGDES